MLHGEEAALEVDREDAVPDLLRKLDYAADLDDADVVVEHVDAPEAIEAGGDRPLDIRGARGVGAERLRLAAFAPDDLDGLARSALVHVDAEDPSAFAGEEHGGGLAVAPAGADRARADHERRLAGEPSCHAVLRISGA